MLPEWRVFYWDEPESSFDSNSGDPSQAPRDGFVCAIGYDEGGKRYIMHGWDFYRWDEDASQFWGMDIFGLLDWLKRRKMIKTIVPGNPTTITTVDGPMDIVGIIHWLKDRREIFEGRTLNRSDWEKYLLRAHNDPEFPIGGR